MLCLVKAWGKGAVCSSCPRLLASFRLALWSSPFTASSSGSVGALSNTMLLRRACLDLGLRATAGRTDTWALAGFGFGICCCSAVHENML
jgi:hypothetical protein